MTSADLLILLSDIDGLYTADPRQHPGAAHIPVVEAGRLPSPPVTTPDGHVSERRIS